MDNKSLDNGERRCPLCNLICDSQHSFTVHIRQHNPTDHSHTCSICGKTLSSASSLDRHMLIHSGERPFKCKICSMSFTTNGNMHRHIRNHGVSPKAKRKKYLEESISRPSVYDYSDLNQADYDDSRSQSPLDLSTHCNSKAIYSGMNSINEPSFYCKSSKKTLSNICNGKKVPVTHDECSSPQSISVNQYRSIQCNRCGLLLPNLSSLSSHKCITARMTKATTKNERNSPLIGFHDLTFIDFSSKKYPLIAKSFCEQNIRKASSLYHNFECKKCFKAFPCKSGLNLHIETHTGETYCNICRCDLGTRLKFLAHQVKHRYHHLLSSVNIFNTNSSEVDEDDSHGIRSLVELRKASKLSEDTFLKEKEIFFAMLQLQHRKVQESIYLAEEKSAQEKKEDVDDFDCPSYFINAKPNQSPVKFVDLDQQPQEATSYSSQLLQNNIPTNVNNSSIGQNLNNSSSLIALATVANPLLSNLTPEVTLQASLEKENAETTDFNSIIDCCYNLKSFMFRFNLGQTIKSKKSNALAN